MRSYVHFAILIVIATFGWPASAAEPGGMVGIARSDDGQTFQASGDVLMRDVRSPAIVRMANGELLAICMQAGRAGGRVPLVATRSKDGGRSWSPVRPVEIKGLPEGVAVESFSLLALPSGLVRMYLVTPDAADRGREGAVILSAVTRDGVEFQLDRAARTNCAGMNSVRVVALNAKDSVVLLLVGRKPGDGASGKWYVQRLESADGRRFKSSGRARAISEPPLGGLSHGDAGMKNEEAGKMPASQKKAGKPPAPQGSAGEMPAPQMSIVQVDARQWRMYAVEDGQVRSRVSQDLVRWRDEPGVRLQGASEVAVAMLDDGKAVMLYGTRVSDATASAEPLASATPAQGDSDKSETAAAWEPFASESAAAESASGEATSDIDDVVEAPAIEFAPLPDLRNHVDYTGWVQQFSIPDEQSSFGSYAELSHKMEITEESDVFHDRYNDPNAPPATPEPWSPVDFPSWEKTFQEKQDYMGMFREACLDPRPYQGPMTWSGDVAPEDRILFTSVSPSLAMFRLLTKASMSQAWRAENGSIPPEQMLTAAETCLGNVAQLQESPVFIDRLVGEANRKLVDDNVRWAIQYGVLQTPGELASTMQLLQAKDLPDADPGGFLRREHAAAMEAIQYLFEPEVPGGEPAVRADRVDRLLDVAGYNAADREQYRRRALELTPADAQAAIAETDSYFRKLAEWYEQEEPRADPKELDRLAEQINDRSKLAGMFLPAMGRSGKFIQRAEAGRRATRLICSVELFRAQHGRYPASLDELPAEQVDDVRTDPYSGEDFVYRQTAAGPMIYSVSENGQDDGGSHSGRWAYGQPGTESGDYVFWPPQE